MERVAVFAALRWECTPIVRALKQVQRQSVGDFQTWRALTSTREVWVVKTGIGVDQAGTAARAVAAAATFSSFVSTGCAGALAPKLRPGDLVVADLIVGETVNGGIKTDAGLRVDLQGAASAAALNADLGSILCSRVVLATAEAKRAAAVRHGSVAVEMEGAGLAAAAAASRIPFAAVRAILDTAQIELRHTGKFIDTQTGAVRPVALAAYLMKHPGAVTDLMAMQKMVRAVQDSLQRFFAAWFAAPALS